LKFSTPENAVVNGAVGSRADTVATNATAGILKADKASGTTVVFTGSDATAPASAELSE
jgi:hypothetical protein